jgi:hypothetical protein
MSAAEAAALSTLIRSRRSVRDFLPQPIPQEVLDAVLEDASWAPSWSNTQPYRVAVANGALRDRLAAELCGLFDRGMAAQHGGALTKLKLLLTRKGLPDGDFATQFTYPNELQPRRRKTGRGLYDLLGIGHHDRVARDRQMSCRDAAGCHRQELAASSLRYRAPQAVLHGVRQPHSDEPGGRSLVHRLRWRVERGVRRPAGLRRTPRPPI